MRALFATAVACFALAACDQAAPLPPGMASRITAPGGHYTVAIPAGWSNGVLPTDRPPAEDEMDLGPAPVTIGDSSQGAGTWIAIRSGPPGPVATFNCCAPTPHVTVDGVVVNGGIDDGHYIRAWFIHAVNGQQVQFRATCSYEAPQSTCLAIIDSWRWEPPSRWSPTVIVIAALLGSAVVAGFATGVILLRRRRGPSAKAAEYRVVTRARLTISLAAVFLSAAVPVVSAARLVHEPRTTSSDGQFSLGIPPAWQDVTSTRPSGGNGAPSGWVLEGPGVNGPITVDVSWVDSSSGISQGVFPSSSSLTTTR